MSVEAPSAIISARSGPAVNEGPVGPNFRLEDTMPLTINRFNPVGEIKFNSTQRKPLHIRQAEAIVDNTWNDPLETNEEIKPAVAAVVEHPISKAKKIWEEVREAPDLTADMLTRALLAADAVRRIKTASREQASLLTHLQPEGNTVTGQLNTLSYPTPFLVPVEQIVEEKNVRVEDRDRKRVKILEEGELEELRLKYVKDEPVARQRAYDIGEAVEKAYPGTQIEGDEEIEGSSINKHLHIHEGLISGLVRGTNRPDGSLDETLKDLKAKRFTSKKEAKEYSTFLVSKLVPVTVAKEGDPVKDEDVTRVDKNRSPHREVALRAEKKRKVRVVETQDEPKALTATTIEDFPDLAEVFELKQAA